MHVFRGSNNRLDEANRDRANGDRLFDSQNNNRGGYNVGSNIYVEGSRMEMSWTAQHGMGPNPNTPYNEVIVQMMCDQYLRDGTTTQRIPLTQEADTDYRFGRHESYNYYQDCQTRERNQGLFTASQNLRGNSSIYTRQNPNGNRRGLECPEERDYYPYWGHSPWMDVAVLTNDVSRCAYYQEESQNVKPRFYCKYKWVNGTNGTLVEQTPPTGLRPITPEGCRTIDGNWTEIPSWSLDPPVCAETPWSRDNHLGNVVGGYPATLGFEMPYLSRTNLSDINANFTTSECAFRVRYNITTDDYAPWSIEGRNFTDARYNDRNGLALGLSELYGYEAPFVNNPEVDFGLGVEVELAINTAQYGRTFQDRTHRVEIWPREEEFEEAVIHNLVVQGKRGNIVQTYPGVEYDFMPNRLRVQTDEYIHFHWAGSNTNPANNDGQGQQQSDRSNIAPTLDNARVYPMLVNQSTLFDGEYRHLHGLSTLTPSQYGGELSELDDAGPHFDNVQAYQSQSVGLLRMRTTGNYTYMCTRNNNFSNRSQRGTIIVVEGADDKEEQNDNIGYIVGGVASGVVGVVLVTATVMFVGKSMGAQGAAAAGAKPI
eukprot:CAMPEP_0201489326 /NCGR_PEP_ID=MMETSP0151_2-20130828/22062_1 /ASSEMBLY_ACC=CAM_ASM_000257 /TAXON_ID=200890 /ORGANISM="Paramoeba atlantica, Strain 621/1 / CCAP 1560/9" /LENGTH=597 /DNA_ID=CAMNT_0047874881 /DNA_START=145 /DNA_END=1938 /DNA_ORIENTATION=-